MGDYASVVRENHHKTTGYLVAGRPPCIAIRDDEIHKIDRRLLPLDPATLSDLEPTGSWLMGVILCPGDGTDHVAGFAARTRSAHRLRFYAHPDTDLKDAFMGWKEAGFRRARVDVVSSWKQLHPFFGRALNDQVYEDHS